jgi:hypothetical protein
MRYSALAGESGCDGDADGGGGLLGGDRKEAEPFAAAIR